MKLRLAFVLSVAIVAVPTARGQGTPQQTIVIAESAVRKMSGHKPKKKMPLTARMAVKRQSSVKGTTAKSAHVVPATVTEIKPATRK